MEREREREREREEKKRVIASAAESVKSRVEKHWKVEEQHIEEEQRARNLDFGSVVDYYETPKEKENENEKEREEETAAGQGTTANSSEDDQPAGGKDEGNIEDVWEEAYDEQSSSVYYFNRCRGTTQWEKPQGAKVTPLERKVDNASVSADQNEGGEGNAKSSQKPACRETDVADGKLNREEDKSVWYYRDLNKSVQGPYSYAMLESWISYMPMDVQVWCDTEEVQEELLGKFSEWNVHQIPVGETNSVMFADLMGCSSYLKGWREERGAENCLGYGIAPTISVYKGMLSGEENTNAEHTTPGDVLQADALGGDGERKSQHEYASTGFFNSRTGRLQADEGMPGTVSDAPTSAYSGTGLAHHMDLTTFEQQMQMMKDRKKVKLSKKQLETLKARKKEVKKKMKKVNMPWLYADD